MIAHIQEIKLLHLLFLGNNGLAGLDRNFVRIRDVSRNIRFFYSLFSGFIYYFVFSFILHNFSYKLSTIIAIISIKIE